MSLLLKNTVKAASWVAFATAVFAVAVLALPGVKPALAATPVISALSVSPNTGTSKVGDTITLNIAADATGYTATSIVLNGVDITASNFQDLGGNNYSADYVIANGDADVTSGAITASVVLTDGSNPNAPYTTVTANTLVIDANKPIVSSLVVSPNTGTHKVGDTITLNIGADAAGYTASNITLNGVSITASNFQDLGAGAYSADYVVANGNADVTSGAITASVVLSDTAGNLNTAFTTVTANTLVIDANKPIVSSLVVSPNTGTHKVGDTITLNIGADAAGYTASNITLNGVSITASNFQDLGAGAYSADYVVAEGNADVTSGAITASVVLSDTAGNLNTAFTTVTANTLVIDANKPIVSSLVVSPNTGTHKVGDTITLNIEADAAGYTASNITLNGVSITASNFQDLGAGAYSADYVVAEGNTDVTSGAITASVVLSDTAGNLNTAFTTVTANTLVIDANKPIVSSLVVSPNTGTHKVGDTITLNIGADAAGYTASNITLNGVSITASNFQDLGAGAYSADYVVAEGNTDVTSGAITASVVLSDTAGNLNTAFTTVTANTLVIDANKPIVSSLVVSPNTGTHKVGDTITLNIGADAAGYTASNITLNGVSITASNFQDLGAGAYSADYVVANGNADVTSGAITASVVLSDTAGNLNTAFTTVTANTLVIDANKPIVSSLVVSPNTGTHKVGDTITLNIGADAAGYTASNITLNGVSITASNFQDLGAGAYSADYVVAEGNTDVTSGAITASVVLSDTAGNLNTAFTTVTANTLVIDANKPIVSSLVVSPNTGTHKVGDTITLNIGADAAGYTASNITLNGVSITASNFQDLGAGAYSADYVVANGNADVTSGAITASVVLSDTAGNLNTAFTTVTANTLVIDANKPIVSSLVVSPNTGTHKVGDTITLNIGADAAGYTASNITLNGVSITASNFQDLGAGAYSADYVVAEGNTDVTSGAITASVVLSDTAGNLNTAFTTVTANTLVIDANKPIVSSLVVSPNTGTHKVGDTITLNIGADAAGYTASNITLNGVSITASNFQDLGAGAYSADYVVANGNADVTSGAITASVVLSDTAGNLNTAFTTVTANTLVIDANKPIVSSLVVSPNTGTHKVGDTITLNIGADAAGYTASNITLNGVSITASNFQDLGAGAYSADYVVANGNADVTSGAITASVVLSDTAGNLNTAFTTVTANTLVIDANKPIVSSLVVSPNTGTHKVGDTITLNIGADAAGYTASNITLNGVSITASNFQDLGAGAYSADYVVAEGNTDVTSGAITASVVLSDTAGNLNTAFTTVTANTLVIDAHSPATPTANPVAGTYIGTQNVVLSSVGSTSIRYTTNGTDPATCAGGSLFAVNIPVSSAETIKARGCDAAGNISAMGTFAYVFSSGSGAVGGGGGGGGVPTPTITVRTPVNGASYNAGAIVGLEWVPGNGAFVKYRVSYSSDNGSTWSVIGDNITATTYNWTVLDLSTTQAIIKVDGLDSNGNVIANGISNGNFIVNGTLPPGTPVGNPPIVSFPPPVYDSTATGVYSAALALANTPDINTDKTLVAPPAGTTVYCTAGTLIKGSLSAVYYCGVDGKRYVFVNDKAFFSWYSDFSSVIMLSDATLAMIPLGGNITYRPGSRLVKVMTDPKVYAVARGGMLRWVSSETVAVSLYGANWAQMVDDIPDAFFVNYKIGAQL